jgi:toxin-antitoxin system PIN domain toxin
MYLPDINAWLALAFEAHFHHTVVREWFEKEGSEYCLFCRMTQTGFLRLATNPNVLQDETLTLSEAWTCYDQFLSDHRIDYSSEPLGIEHLWREYTMAELYSPKVWNDAYLAAFARAGTLTLVTFDSSFTRYGDLSVVFLP